MNTDATVAYLNYEGLNIELLQRLLFLLLSEIFTKLSFRNIQHSAAVRHSTLFSLPHFFSGLVLSSLTFKNGRESYCVFWMLLVQLWRFRNSAFFLREQYFPCYHISQLPSPAPHELHSQYLFFPQSLLNTFGFLAKVYKHLQPHTTVSQERMWCLAAECPEHFLRVLNKALNLKKPS
jgi:hypothetical protein